VIRETDITNPFPGPQPYKTSDRDRFYGRDSVARRLSSTILAHRCVALFGPSGAGKSSVMQAAVLPELDDEYDFRHVTVDSWPTEDDPLAWLLDSLHTQLKLVPHPAEQSLGESVEWTIKQAFRRSDRPILIYLDQIEQLLLPHRSNASVDTFFAWLDTFAERPHRGLHLVLAMREDYLGRFRDRAHGRHRLLENGFRLGPLTVGEIVGAVCSAASDGTPSQTWPSEPMRTLMLQVRTPGSIESDKAEIQTAFAQIVCRALFVERAARGELIAPVHDEIKAEPILQRYLENTLERLGPLRGAAERLMEDHLVAADGTRSILTEEAARASELCSIDELAVILTDLEQAAILRAEQHRGTRYFEIGHDWLAKKVFDRKAERIAKFAELARQQELEAQAQAVEKQLDLARAETRRARKVVAIVTLLGLLALALGLYAWTQRQMAQDEADRAGAAENKAIVEKDRAELATSAAETARKRAEDDRKRADEARVAADKAREQARVAADEAVEQKTIAEAQRRTAETAEKNAQTALVGQRRATSEAETQRSAALVNLERAEEESRRARDANHLAVALSVLGDDPTLALALLREVEDPASTRGWTPATVEALQRPASRAIIRGHEGYVVDAAFSPDGGSIATASHDLNVQLTRINGETPPLSFSGHTEHVTDVAFSPDGRFIASASIDGSVRLWSPDSETPKILAGSGDPVEALAFSPDGKELATASSDGIVRIYASDGEAAVKLWRGHEGAVRSVRFRSNGSHLLTSSDDGTARIWSLRGPKRAPVILRGHEGTVHAAAFSPNGRRVVTAGDDRSVRIWNTHKLVAGDELQAAEVLLGHTDAVYSADFDFKGERVVSASRDRTARIWRQRPNGDAEVRVLSGHRDKVLTARFNRSSTLVATASRDGTARLWPVDGGEARVLRGHSAPVVAVEFSNDGSRIVTAAEDSTARVWDVADRHSEQVLRGHKGPVLSASFTGGDQFLTAGGDHSIRLWSLRGDTPRVEALIEKQDGELLLATTGPKGKLITGSSDGKVRIWNVTSVGGKTSVGIERTVDLELEGRPNFITVSADGRRILTSAGDVVWVIELDGGGRTSLIGHRGKVQHASFSLDGLYVVTASDDRSARIWRADNQTTEAVLRGHEGTVYHADFSPDGASIVTASWDRTARIWAVDTGRQLQVFTGHDKVVRSAAFSSDGKRVVTSSDDGTARIWRSDGTGDVVTLYGHEGAIQSAVFSPDGLSILTASDDQTARVWQADFDNPALLRAKIEETTTVCLVPEQRIQLLAESAEDAEIRHKACESGFGR